MLIEKQRDIYKKLIEYYRVSITLSEFKKIVQNHSNLYLPDILDDIVNHGRFISFRKFFDALLAFPDQNFDSFQMGQLESKKWLIQKLNMLRNLNYSKFVGSPADHMFYLNEQQRKHENIYHSPEILVVGGWHGILALMMKHYAYFDYTILITDIEPDCIKVAKMFGCVTSIVDMFEIEYDIVPADFIINTSCEHIDFDKWIKLIPKGKVVVLQSTDMVYKNHIDNMYSIEEFISRAKLSEVYSVDTRNFYGADQYYNRYLLIGKR